MSLKSFHLFFIVVSTLLSFGFGVWSVAYHFTYGSVGYLIMGGISFVIAIVLIFYGIYFVRKLKHISYM